MTRVWEVHNHLLPEGHSREVNTGKEPLKTPPKSKRATLRSEKVSASAPSEAKLPGCWDSVPTCESKGSKGEVPGGMGNE